jgi:hypothetical protein
MNTGRILSEMCMAPARFSQARIQRRVASSVSMSCSGAASPQRRCALSPASSGTGGPAQPRVSGKRQTIGKLDLGRDLLCSGGEASMHAIVYDCALNI